LTASISSLSYGSRYQARKYGLRI